MKKLFLLLISLMLVSIVGCSKENTEIEKENKTIRIGFFPNVTHTQALIGKGSEIFKKRIDSDYSLEWKKFNAGPAELEALLTEEIDIGYIGPGPAVNGYKVSEGELQIIAGVSEAGAVLVKGKNSDIETVDDLKNKKISIPQYGNTQDIVLRGLMKDNNLKDTVRGGTVEVVQASNPDVKLLLEEENIDAAFVPEPWGSRLEKEIGAEVVLDYDETWREGEYSSAVIVARAEFVKENPEAVKQFLEAHVDATNYINNSPKQAKAIINSQIKELMREPLESDVLDRSMNRLTVTYDPNKESIEKIVSLSEEIGYLRGKTDLTDVFNLSILNEVLQDRKLENIK